MAYEDRFAMVDGRSILPGNPIRDGRPILDVAAAGL
jgi:hypothetical protein